MRLGRYPGVVGIAAIVAACGGAQLAGEPDGAEHPLELVEAQPTVDGAPLPERARASRTVVVFFASWCAPCRRELSMLKDLSAELPGLRIILVNAFEDYADRSDERSMRAFLDEQGIAWPVVRDSPEIRAAFGGVRKIPALFVFDERGREVARFRRQDRPMPEQDELRASLSAR